jgi:transcriptional regulator with XRE-family HTH domain
MLLTSSILTFGSMVRATTPPRFLAVLRFAAGLSQQALADRAGVSRLTVINLERGKTKRPHPLTAAALADALGVEVDVLFPEKGDGAT